jgi:hypothetical protein
MYTEVEYSYECDECHKEVKNTRYHNSCSGCSINLCKACYRKRNVSLCLWCFNELPDEYIWQLKFTKYLMVLVPILILLIPTPIPWIFRLFLLDNSDNLLIIGFIFLITSFIIFGFMQYYCARKVMTYIN